MAKYKVNSLQENCLFVITRSYKRLQEKLKKLKKKKGQIIHVIGAPGTGKSSNIYHALQDVDMDIYNARLVLYDENASSKTVFDSVYQTMLEDHKVKTKDELYNQLSGLDAILFADNFHDTHLLEEGMVGFSKWTESKGLKSFYFYLLCIREYILHRKQFKKINIILQTAWRAQIAGRKYDLFSDLGPLSKLMVAVLKTFFTVVEISYSQRETISIVKMHLNDADEDRIRLLIKRYGCKPRFICDAIENR